MIKFDKGWEKKSEIAIALVDLLDRAGLTSNEIRYTLREGLKILNLRAHRRRKSTKKKGQR